MTRPNSRRTFGSFGYEWSRFPEVKADDRRVFELWFADVPWSRLSGSRALDAGCGRGQFARFAAGWLKSIVALDPSEAVHVARRILSAVPAASVVQADLLCAPFPDQCFDFVFCMGVLHHLSDPEAGFRASFGWWLQRG